MVDGDRLRGPFLIEETGLSFEADERLGEVARRDAATSVEFPELGDGFLAHRSSGADGAHESPVGVRLAVLGDRGVAQVHRRLRRS
jgi:hypothetical protein